MRLETLVSLDASPYLAWQGELLAATHRTADVPGLLTRLVLEPGDPRARAYPPLNKPSAVAVWSTSAAECGDPILLLDPDCVFVSSPDGLVSGGQPLAQPAPYLDPWQHRDLLARHGLLPEDVQAIGTPALIGRDELRALAPAWLECTRDILDDPQSRREAGWVAEMWGYVIAAARLGIHHAVVPFAHALADDCLDRPLIHYCDTLRDQAGNILWDKRCYAPWSPPPASGAAVPLAGATLLELLADHATRVRAVRGPDTDPGGPTA
jgi:hypothetical protein